MGIFLARNCVAVWNFLLGIFKMSIHFPAMLTPLLSRSPRNHQDPYPSTAKLRGLVLCWSDTVDTNTKYPIPRTILRTSKHRCRMSDGKSIAHQRHSSSTIMHKIHPPFQGDSSLSPQLLCRMPQRCCGSLIIWHAWVLARK